MLIGKNINTRGIIITIAALAAVLCLGWAGIAQSQGNPPNSIPVYYEPDPPAALTLPDAPDNLPVRDDYISQVPIPTWSGTPGSVDLSETEPPLTLTQIEMYRDTQKRNGNTAGETK